MVIGKKLLIVVYFFVGDFTICHAQNDQYFDALKVQPIENLDWRNDNSLAMVPFKKIFSNYNIVTLAMSSHLDGAAYDAQCMLMKELINAGEINTIYTESSCLNIDKINTILRKKGKEGILQAEYYFGSAELSYWSHNGFWEFLANKIIDGSVNLVGIDIETTSDTLMREMLLDAGKLNSVSSYAKEFPETHQEIMIDFSSIRTWFRDVNYSREKFQNQSELIELILIEYNSKKEVFKVKQWQTVLKYLNWRHQRSCSIGNDTYSSMLKNSIKLCKFFSIRDSMMADIMLDHYTSNKDVKAVLLVTAYHAQRKYFYEGLESLIDPNTHFLGNILDKKLKGKVYNICFVSSSGKSGRIFFSLKELEKIQKPVKGSLEYFFRKSDINYFFSDIRESPLESKNFSMKVLFRSYLNLKWSELFDGVFFIKKMYPFQFQSVS